MKIDIKKVDGKWLINGKSSEKWIYEEKTFFDEFLIAMRLMDGAEKHDNLKLQSC